MPERSAERFESLLLRAMLEEISITPKPGLVDRSQRSAHRDMDFFSFVRSSAAIAPFFRRIFLLSSLGAESEAELFRRARGLGIEAEHAMFAATGGINTQKGIVFLGGLLSLVAGFLAERQRPWTEANLREGILFFSKVLEGELEQSREKTHGEILFRRCGARGIRGELEKGLPCVFEEGLPVLRRRLLEGHSFNEAGLEALFAIIARCEDTTILWRHGPAVLDEVKGIARDFLERGGIANASTEDLIQLDRDFSRRGISPGGSADLLFLTFALHSLVSAFQCEESKFLRSQ